MDKRFLSIIVALALIFGGFLIFNGKKSQTSTNNSSSNKAVAATNHTYGEGKSGVVLIEYGDFQCPACGQYYPIVKQVKEKFKPQITFQFRHFPLETIHPNARAGSRAAEAAAKQNKFWEMHNKLYESQQEWANSSNPVSLFEGYAQELGLDVNKFKIDFASSEINSLINADMAEGNKLGATSTPTFVLNGKKIEENPRSLDAFNKLIQEAIDSKNPSQKSTGTEPTTPPAQ